MTNEEHTAASHSRAVSIADEEAVKAIISSSVMGLWDIVDNLTRLRPTKRERYRVAIFGSARPQAGSFGYEQVKRAAAAFTEMGCDIVTGGGPGLMQAANEGAASTGLADRSTGIRIDLPFEQDVNPFVQHAYEHKTFFSRLHHFVLTSDAFVVAPGGIGTVLETMMIWQLLQVRHLQHVPLLLVGEMWPGLVEWVRDSMLPTDPPLISPGDADIPRCLADADEAIAVVRELHEQWKREQNTSH